MSDDGNRPGGPGGLQVQADRLRVQRTALARFGLFAFRSEDLDAVLHEACRLVAEGLDAKMAKVLELRHDTGDFLVRAGIGWKPGVVGWTTFGADDASPAGYALKVDQPVISRDVSTEDRFGIPEVLTDHNVRSMVNVVIAGEDGPYGVLEVDAPRHHDFDEEDVAFLETYANLVAAAIERMRGHAALGRALSEQRVLVQELAHRVRNMLGLVQALAKQTVADDPAARAYRDTFLGRLNALARAESLILDDHPQCINLARLAPDALAPFVGETPAAVSIDGAALWVPARMGRILSLVLHELATNATKYGALSVPDSRVRLGWRAEEEGAEALRARLWWVEEGGPRVQPPRREGFGTRLLTTVAGHELDGRAHIDLRPEGIVYELDFAVPRDPDEDGGRTVGAGDFEVGKPTQ